MLLGAHVSVAKGLHNGPVNGVALGCDVIQVFTRNQRQWKAKPVTDEEAEAFKSSVKETKVRGVMSHASYLINLASPKPDVRRMSRQAFIAEAERCQSLGIDRFVFHPGAHLDAGVEAGVARVAEALAGALDATQGSRVLILLETMAGQGTTLGDRFEDLDAMIRRAGGSKRLGICIDTCHVFAAGHDIRTQQGYDAVIDRVDDTVGLQRVHGFHLNDSKMPLGARRDRHADIGEGAIGLGGFRPLMRDERFAKLPMVLETPGGDEGYREGLKRLRSITA